MKNISILARCHFKEIHDPSPRHETVQNFYYLYFPNKTAVSILQNANHQLEQLMVCILFLINVNYIQTILQPLQTERKQLAFLKKQL